MEFLSIIDGQTVPMSNDKVQLKMLKCKNNIDSVLFKLKEDKPGLNWLKQDGIKMQCLKLV